MSKIISIGTATPAYKHAQDDILLFMQRVYAMNSTEARKLKFLYHHSGIENRYSVIPDYSRETSDWKFYPHTENLEPFPSLEQRMAWYQKHAATLSVDAIRNAMGSLGAGFDITHLITVSCTGMSAPGLDLQIMELMELPKNIYRTSVNFMGCYAAIHGMKMADAICKSDPGARVMVVCTELCTLHFQRESTMDNMAASLLFSDGSAAALVVADTVPARGLRLDGFYSEVLPRGKRDMSWEISSSGFLMTLSGYIPELIGQDFVSLLERSLAKIGIPRKEISEWCVHPGGKRILDTVHKSMQFSNGQLNHCYEVLREYGNMSSATILFVLKRIMREMVTGKEKDGRHVFAAAFGPGLTMETFVATV